MVENIFQIVAEVSHQAKTKAKAKAKAKANARAKVKVTGHRLLAERESTEESIGKCGALSAVQS